MKQVVYDFFETCIVILSDYVRLFLRLKFAAAMMNISGILLPLGRTLTCTHELLNVATRKSHPTKFGEEPSSAYSLSSYLVQTLR